jgi:glutamate formiminotransferase/formiminotetrahydrofolate cyclodeaminase
VRVSGSEIVGLVPLEALLEAGRHYLRKQQRSVGVSDRELIKIAVKSMGLDDLTPFDPDRKVIEYVLAAREGRERLVDLGVQAFIEETAAESPAPGGGSVAASVGALGAALGTMVANLSSHRRGWDDRWEEFSDWAERGKSAHAELTRLVDADTDAFNALMAAFGLPKGSEAEEAARQAAIQEATRRATEVPLRVMELALESMDVIEAMARTGMETSVSDAGVGALCARAAVRGAGLNVRINAKSLADEGLRTSFLERVDELEKAAEFHERTVLEAVEHRL